jgi:hypothetical protein
MGTSDTDDTFGLASSIGMNGLVHEIVYASNGGGRDKGDAIGVFKGHCTVVSEVRDELLCAYEIGFITNGDNGIGGVIAKGHVSGAQGVAIVTGAEYDFEQFSGGSLTTLQDPDRQLLFAYLDLA